MTKNTSTSTAATVKPMTLAQARAGKVPGGDVDAFLKTQHARTAQVEKDKGLVLWDNALGFLAVVEVDGLMTQGAYASAIYGGPEKGNANGTMLKRLAHAATYLGVSRTSNEWRYLVQKSTSAAVGAVLKGIEKDDADRPAALAALKSQADEWSKSGKVTQGARTPSTESQETQDETERPAPRTAKDALTRLREVEDIMNGLPRDAWSTVLDALETLHTAQVKKRETIGHPEVAATDAA